MNSEAQRTIEPGPLTVQVADTSLMYREVVIPSATPTGAQLALAAGFNLEENLKVLAVLPDGELRDVQLANQMELVDVSGKFVIALCEHSYKFSINGTIYEWPLRIISGGQLRKLGHAPPDMLLCQDLPDAVERIIDNHQLVDLAGSTTATFATQPKEWKLNVQGVTLVVPRPSIKVREAIKDAGFDPNKPWIIVLRVHGQPKREVGLDDMIDLKTPGIEKLRLTPRDINNGEPTAPPLRMFSLLDVDEKYLNGLGLRWETVKEGINPNQCRRWLLIHDYPIPGGYSSPRTLLALEIPLTYPAAQIDMFYTSPPLALVSGVTIPRTQVEAKIGGVDFNGWSRHRGEQSKWDPLTDNVATHLALVEAAMLKEIRE